MRGKGDAAGGGTAPCQLRRASMQCLISKITTGRTFSTDCLNYSRKKSDPSLRLVNHCFLEDVVSGASAHHGTWAALVHVYIKYNPLDKS